MMKRNESYVAYTIIVQRNDGKPMFLVEHEKSAFGFPAIKASKGQSGLAQIIEEIKSTLKNPDIDNLELSELTNVVINELRIPLFVFTYHCGECPPEYLLLQGSNLEWQISDNFQDTLKQYDISGVPLF